MTVEDLMKPRYKVIADYPYCPYQIGELVEISDTGTSFHCTTTKEYDSFLGETSECENYFEINRLEKYPHLFRALMWWEGREIKDLPKYLSMITISGTIFFKVDSYEEYYVNDAEIPHDSFLAYSDELNDCAPLVFCSPATLEEYNEYKPKQ